MSQIRGGWVREVVKMSQKLQFISLEVFPKTYTTYSFFLKPKSYFCRNISTKFEVVRNTTFKKALDVKIRTYNLNKGIVVKSTSQGVISSCLNQAFY